MSEWFGQAQQALFEGVVQPLMFQLGLANLLEDADWEQLGAFSKFAADRGLGHEDGVRGDALLQPRGVLDWNCRLLILK